MHYIKPGALLEQLVEMVEERLMAEMGGRERKQEDQEGVDQAGI